MQTSTGWLILAFGLIALCTALANVFTARRRGDRLLMLWAVSRPAWAFASYIALVALPLRSGLPAATVILAAMVAQFLWIRRRRGLARTRVGA